MGRITVLKYILQIKNAVVGYRAHAHTLQVCTSLTTPLWSGAIIRGLDIQFKETFGPTASVSCTDIQLAEASWPVTTTSMLQLTTTEKYFGTVVMWWCWWPGWCVGKNTSHRLEQVYGSLLEVWVWSVNSILYKVLLNNSHVVHILFIFLLSYFWYFIVYFYI